VTLRKLLILPLLVSIIFFIVFSTDVRASTTTLLHHIHFTVPFVLTILSATLLQLTGHVVRAYKMRYLLEPVKSGTLRFQFRALSIGYLFSALLPFRLGELIRAQVIANGERISFGFTLLLIILERVFDAFLLAIMGGVVLGLIVHNTHLLHEGLLLTVVALAFTLLLILIYRADRKVLLFWHAFTALFNRNIQNSMRFKLWSGIYGFQKVVSPPRMLRYAGLTLLAWLFYLSSILIVAVYFLHPVSTGTAAAATVSPFYGVSVPLGPANLGSFSNITDSSLQANGGTTLQLLFTLMSWTILIIPISILGLLFLFTKTPESLRRQLPRQASEDSLTSKLLRDEDISQELESYLDNFFRANDLSRIIHKMELQDKFQLIKHFKGGSAALTLLVKQDQETVVKKITNLNVKDKLRDQYAWLDKYNDLPYIAQPVGMHETDDHFAIDIAYRKEFVTFFEHIHSASLAQSWAILKTIVTRMSRDIYDPVPAKKAKAKLQTYITDKIIKKVRDASAFCLPIASAAEYTSIIINGREVSNFYQVVERLQRNKQAMRDLQMFDTTDIHGDLSIDNVIVNPQNEEFLLLDPNNENAISDPIVDFAKLYQSLHSGYEFLIQITNVSAHDNVIMFTEQKSAQYDVLYTRLDSYLQKKLPPEKYRALLFHEAVHYCRLLTYRVNINHDTAVAFYAIAVRLLNDFLDQYEGTS